MFWANFKINNTPWLAACLLFQWKNYERDFLPRLLKLPCAPPKLSPNPPPPDISLPWSHRQTPGKGSRQFRVSQRPHRRGRDNGNGARVGDGDPRVHDIGPMPHQAADSETRGHGLAFQQGYGADSYIDRPHRSWWQSWNRQPTSLLKFRTSIQAIRPLTASVSIHET